jgi:16S rRNA (uracil1498-N3)-methyltransferase
VIGARGPAGVHAVAHVFVAALDDRCEISGPDGHHLQRVRRLTPGEIVTAADGSGAWRTYAVSEIGDHELTLEARGDVEVEPESELAVSLAVALTKGGLDEVMAAVTELGVARVTPVRTERVIVRWDENRQRKAVARLRSVAREAAMQSRRARIPVVDEVADLPAVVDRPGLVVAAGDGAAPSELPRPGGSSTQAGWTVLVGPEGGFSPAELELLAECPRLRLGQHVLRASTAPIAAVAVLGAEAVRLRSE